MFDVLFELKALYSTGQDSQISTLHSDNFLGGSDSNFHIEYGYSTLLYLYSQAETYAGSLASGMALHNGDNITTFYQWYS